MRTFAALGLDRGRPERYADVEVELGELIFRRILLTLVLATTGVVGSLSMLAHHFHDPKLWTLAGVTFALCSLRMGIAIKFAARSKALMAVETARNWQMLYAVPTFIYCCVVAWTTWYNFRHYPIVGSRVSMISTFCVCACVYSRIGMRPWFLNCCGLLMLTVLGVAVWQTHGAMSVPAALLLAFFAYQYCASVENQFHIVVEQYRSRHQLRAMAEQDVLTGLANRRHFQTCLAALCHQAEPFSILYIDLDRFKRVNDTLGHAAGDALLVQVAERLRLNLRETDLLARLGGDEFAILQFPVDYPSAVPVLARQINESIGAPFVVEGERVEIGASVGLRLVSEVDTDPRIVLSKVDKALYKVKQEGGGSFCLAEA